MGGWKIDRKSKSSICDWNPNSRCLQTPALKKRGTTKRDSSLSSNFDGGIWVFWQYSPVCYSSLKRTLRIKPDRLGPKIQHDKPPRREESDNISNEKGQVGAQGKTVIYARILYYKITSIQHNNFLLMMIRSSSSNRYSPKASRQKFLTCESQPVVWSKKYLSLGIDL